MSEIVSTPFPPPPSSAADPADLGVLEAAQQLRARRLSSAELTDACLRRIEERGGGEPTFDGAPDRINAWARLYPDLARDHARRADERRAREADDTPLLCGIPIGVKDLYAVAGLPLTASSRVLEGNLASADSPAWRSLHDRGMVLLGHTHMHEFAAGGTTDQVGNPHDLRLVVGGSSGGSAAALAARMTPAALGSDTCGSLRIPSACCGTSAIKPTHGRISLDGIVPLAPSLDHPGPMARTVADCAALLEAMADRTAAVTPLLPPPAPTGPLPLAARAGPRPLEGITVAVTDRTSEIPMHDEVARGLEQAVNACERLGASIVERPAPWTLDPDDLSWVLMAEVWAYHRRHAERHDRYRAQVGEFIEAARDFTDAQAYIVAQTRRAQGTAAWEEWFAENRIHAVLEPTLPILPFERGVGYDPGQPAGPGDPMIALTALWDMTGMPAVSLPVSWSVGMSLIAPRGREVPLTQIAIDLQEHALGIPADPGSQ
ncbi:MAG: amidase [Solirubrobacterales bacterium]|nr:amidase [Solirubrobacterales bacterium]